MSRYWSAVVRGLTPYVPGEQPRLPNLVKLNTNECPYGPSRRVLEALRLHAMVRRKSSTRRAVRSGCSMWMK